MSKTVSVAIIYHMFPHYREGVMKALNGSQDFSFTFIGATKAFEGIEPAKVAGLTDFRSVRFWRFRSLYWQTGILRVVLSGHFDAIVFLGNPNFISTWIAATLARLMGTKVLYWTHGWLKPEGSIKELVRSAFYSLSDRILVYGERAKTLGAQSGHSPNQIDVIYNSLDAEKIHEVLARIESRSSEATVEIREKFKDSNRPLIVCTARLTKLCRFDILFEAAEQLRSMDHPVNIILVGDGPERSNLEQLAATMDINVYFWGACYAEDIIGQIIYNADLSCSPGKIGLTAIHSLSYGTPAITHSDMNNQMPEAEALIEGKTGAFFHRDDPYHLASVIAAWLATNTDRAATRSRCLAEINARWTPERQKELIENALMKTMAVRR